MNAYKLNGMAGHYFRKAICKGLKIPHGDIYKTVKSIDGPYDVITMHDGREFVLKLVEIK